MEKKGFKNVYFIGSLVFKHDKAKKNSIEAQKGQSLLFISLKQ